MSKKSVRRYQKCRVRSWWLGERLFEPRGRRNEDVSKLLQRPGVASGHAAAKPDTGTTVAAGCLIKRVHACAGALRRTPESFLARPPQKRCQALKLPRSIRGIFEDSTRNFTDDFFNSRPTVVPSALYVIAPPPPPPLHLPISL